MPATRGVQNSPGIARSHPQIAGRRLGEREHWGTWHGSAGLDHLEFAVAVRRARDFRFWR